MSSSFRNPSDEGLEITTTPTMNECETLDLSPEYRVAELLSKLEGNVIESNSSPIPIPEDEDEAIEVIAEDVDDEELPFTPECTAEQFVVAVENTIELEKPAANPQTNGPVEEEAEEEAIEVEKDTNEVYEIAANFNSLEDDM